MSAIDIATVAKQHGLKLTPDLTAIDFAGGRVVAFGDLLVFITTTRATSEEAGNVIRRNAELLINWNSETGNLTAIIGPPSKLNDLILKVRNAELESRQPPERLK